MGVGLTRARGRCAQGRIGALLADGDHSHLGHLGHLVAERVAVELLVLAVQPLQRPRKAGLVELQGVELHQLAEVLAHVAHADIAGDARLAL